MWSPPPMTAPTMAATMIGNNMKTIAPRLAQSSLPILRPLVPLLGASGAIFALQAFSAGVMPDRVFLWFGMRLTAMQLLLTNLAIHILQRMQGHTIDGWCHAGGALFGRSSRSRRPDVCVMFLTGYPNLLAEVRCFDPEPLIYTKPVNYASLSAALLEVDPKA